MTEEEITKDERKLFAMAVEDALNEMGSPTLDIMNRKLFKDYHCSIEDCLQRPEILKSALNEVFGYADIAVIAKIKRNLGDFSQERPITDFLRVLSK